MKEYKGTPGPWVSCGSIYQDYGYHIKSGEKTTICIGIAQTANANLIAAAPELLSAVNLILELQLRGFITLGDKHTGTLSSAVAKAPGESQ